MQTSNKDASTVSQLKGNLDAAYRKMPNVVTAAAGASVNFTAATASIVLPSESYMK